MLKFLKFVVLLGLILGVVGSVAVVGIFWHYSKDLPDHMKLANYNPPTVTRLYAADGAMLAEYATEKRLFVPISAIPKRVVNAFIAAEDKNFYHHPGVDVTSIFRAAINNVVNYGKNKSLAGGSTITQQVVKNFLLTNEKSLRRKIREAILAFRITKAFPKDRIMELYLNQIYLGNRSYGVAAAALNYFDKSVGELSIEEVALLAAMPKAPSRLDPNKFPERALERRNWVIGRMNEEGFITSNEAQEAKATPITMVDRPTLELVNAGFFTDTVKQELISMYSEKAVMEDGMAVRTTLDPELQSIAEDALMKGLRRYDHRHGWRGPITKLDPQQPDWMVKFEAMERPASLGLWDMALVTNVENDRAHIYLNSKHGGTIPLRYMRWARDFIDRDTVGGAVEDATQVLSKGDVIAVSLAHENTDDSHQHLFRLEQIPEVNGAIVAMDPHTGKVLAMVGGYYYGGSQFNRAVQAKRQPGSAFKPFAYLAAFENGFAPNSIVVDEAIVLDQGDDQQQWSPQNHSEEYYGPTTLRIGVEKSRNVMTVRLAEQMGIGPIVKMAQRLNIHQDPPRNFAMVLGASETTLIDLTTAYAMLVNGGKKVSPSLIERIQDRQGRTIYKRDARKCIGCDALVQNNDELPFLKGIQQAPKEMMPPFVGDQRQQIIDPIAAYQIVSILEGVVQRGTGKRAKKLKRTLAGKTGTTNDSFDAWFMGFTADLALGVYVGFDLPKTLGKHEYGSSVALPIWTEFMKQALKDKPDIPFRRPDGVKLVKVDINNGLLPSPDSDPEDIIFEAFRVGTEPTSSGSQDSGFSGSDQSSEDWGTIY